MIGKRQLYRRIAKEVEANKVLILQSRIKNDSTNSIINIRNVLTGPTNIDITLPSPPNIENSLSYPPNIENYSCLEHDSSVAREPFSIQFCQRSIEEVSINPASFIAGWASRFNISHVAINSLLQFLKNYINEIPLDSRTVLNTPTGKSKLLSKKLCNGELVYFGLNNAIKTYLSITQVKSCKIELSFNIDGIPLFHSSPLQFWPILVSINNTQEPYVVSIYCGKSKPLPLNDYLSDFIHELNELLSLGFWFKSEHYSVQVQSFICDAPARAFLKAIKGHGGYSSCEKCTCYGSYINGRVVLNDLNCSLRTDVSFSEQTDEDHHTGISPLASLPIGMVSQFPIDYMHCVCLGVVRKLLNLWVKGKNKNVKLDSKRVQLVSDKLLALCKYVPKDFNRKPRGLNELDHWKATEFRTFLLYTGPLVLKDVLNKDAYDHFLYLHVGISCLLSPLLVKDKSQLADKLLRKFVSLAIKNSLYGKEFVIYNVHYLIHLSKEADTFGVLDNVAAFKFENFLGQLKKKIRSPNKPLQQVTNRVLESNHFSYKFPLNTDVNQTCNFPHNGGPLTSEFMFTFCIQFEELLICDSVISIKKFSDSCIAVDTGKIIIVKNIVSFQCSIYIIGSCFQTYDNYYTYPCKSLNIGVCLASNLADKLSVFKVSCIVAKCVIFPTSSSKYLVLPVLHSLQ